jgi:hypothetical protein
MSSRVEHFGGFKIVYDGDRSASTAVVGLVHGQELTVGNLGKHIVYVTALCSFLFSMCFCFRVYIMFSIGGSITSRAKQFAVLVFVVHRSAQVCALLVRLRWQLLMDERRMTTGRAALQW